MTLREALIGLVDDIRQNVIADALGLRLHVTQTRLRTWSGTERGSGSYSDVITTLLPPPRVRPSNPVQGSEAGKREVGDVTVDRLSATMTQAQLFPAGLGQTVEFTWLIDGLEYTPAERPRETFLGWSIRLTRVGSRR